MLVRSDLPGFFHIQSCFCPEKKIRLKQHSCKMDIIKGQTESNLRDCICDHNGFKGAVVQSVQSFTTELSFNIKTRTNQSFWRVPIDLTSFTLNWKTREK